MKTKLVTTMTRGSPRKELERQWNLMSSAEEVLDEEEEFDLVSFG
jgi:hypothetical protein